MAAATGSVAVEVVPDARQWAARVRAAVLPDADRTGQDWGKLFGAAAAKAIGDAVSDGVARSARKAEGDAPAQGEATAGAFAKAFKARLEAALRSLPAPELQLDMSEADRKLAELYDEIHALSDQKVGIDISDAEAVAKVESLAARLREFGQGSDSARVQVDTASAAADLEAFGALVKARMAETGRSAGEEFGGKFADTLRAKLASAMKALPKAEITADSTPADRAIADIRAQLEALRDKRIGVDITDAQALAELDALRARLEALGAASPSVRVRMDLAAAAAELAAFQAEVAKVDHERVEVVVDADTGAAESKMAALGAGADTGRSRVLALTAAIFGLGPALIPIAAVGAAAFAALAVGAIAAAGAVAVLFLALGPVVAAIQAVTKAHTQSAAAAASGVSRAIQLANAHDQLASATRALAAAEADAASQRIAATERVTDAERARDDAVRASARDQIEQARRVTDARQTLADAQKRAADQQVSSDRQVQAADRALADAQAGVERAQRSLTDARRQAARDAEDLANSVIDGRNSEREAVIRVADAQRALDNTWANGGVAAQRQHELAQIALDEAKQGLSEQRTANERLADQKAASDKAGVEGSAAVTNANQQLLDAQQRLVDAQQAATDAAKAASDQQVASARAIADAQRGLTDTLDAAAEKRRADDEKIANAQRGLADAVRGASDQQRHSVDALANAHQALVQAHRGVQQAAEKSAVAGGQALDTARQKLEALSPAGRTFVTFVTTELLPAFHDLSREVQTGFLPGLQAGLEYLLPSFGGLKSFIGDISREMGDLAASAGKALTDPFWTQFFTFVRTEAVPAINLMGRTFGNFVTGIAGLLQAFQPVADGLGLGLLGLSQRFADFGKGAGRNAAFQGFLAYIRDNGPLVAKTFGDLVGAAGAIVRALAPVGVVVLKIVDGLARLIEAAPPSVIQAVVVAIGGFSTAMLILNGAMTAGRVAMGIYTAVAGAYSLITGEATLATLGLDAALGPIIAVVLAVIAVIVAIGVAVYEAYQHWTPFRVAVDTTWAFIKTATADAWDFLRPILAAIGDFIMNTLVPAFEWLWRNVVEPVWTGILAAVRIAWDAIKVIFVAMDVYFRTVLKPFWDFILDYIVKPLWTLIRSAIEVAWVAIQVVFKLMDLYFRLVLKPIWDWIYDHIIEPLWSKISSTVSDVWEHGIKPVFSALGDFIKTTVAPAFQKGIDAIEKIWNTLKEIASVPIRFVVNTVINKGIIATWRKVADFFGIKTKIDDVQLPPGMQRGGRLPGYGGGDRIPAMLEAGETVVPKHLTPVFAQAFGAAGIPGFATGGLIGTVKSIGGSLVDLIGDPAGWVKDHMSGVLAGLSGLADGPFGAIARALPTKLVDLLVGKATSLASSFGIGGGGSAGGGPAIGGGNAGNQAIGQQMAAALYGWAGPQWSALRSLWNGESGWNHLARNPSSGAYGIPQSLPASKMASAGPDWPTNPATQIRWGLGYIHDAYGSPENAYGKWLARSPHWYDSGGYLPTGISTVINNTGRPEPVLTGAQWDAMLKTRTADSGRPPVTVHVTNPVPEPASESATRIMRRLASVGAGR